MMTGLGLAAAKGVKCARCARWTPVAQVAIGFAVLGRLDASRESAFGFPVAC